MPTPWNRSGPSPRRRRWASARSWPTSPLPAHLRVDAHGLGREQVALRPGELPGAEDARGERRRRVLAAAARHERDRPAVGAAGREAHLAPDRRAGERRRQPLAEAHGHRPRGRRASGRRAGLARPSLDRDRGGAPLDQERRPLAAGLEARGAGAAEVDEEGGEEQRVGGERRRRDPGDQRRRRQQERDQGEHPEQAASRHGQRALTAAPRPPRRRRRGRRSSVNPSSSDSALRITRCPQQATRMRFRSSGDRKSRPARSARARAVSRRARAARGLTASSTWGEARTASASARR